MRVFQTIQFIGPGSTGDEEAVEMPLGPHTDDLADAMASVVSAMSLAGADRVFTKTLSIRVEF